MNFTTEGLSQPQLEILRQAGPWLADQGFYLAGGTALAMVYGHRKSVDLDWFTRQAISDPLVLAQRLRDFGLAFETGQTAPGTLYGQIHGVRLSFIEFRYPLLQPVQVWQEMGTPLASLDDLACMKLSAVAQRGARKDFYDLHALLTHHRPLKELLGLYQHKFSVQDLTPVIYGLAYFDDAEQEPEPVLLVNISWRQIKKDILGWLQDAVRSN